MSEMIARLLMVLTGFVLAMLGIIKWKTTHNLKSLIILIRIRNT